MALEKTDQIYGACKVGQEKNPVFYLAAGGRFPVAAIRFGLSHGDDWEHVELPKTGRLPKRDNRMGDSYWISRRTPIQVYLTRESSMLACTEDIRPMIELYRDRLYHRTSSLASIIPAEVLEEMDISNMVVYFPSMSRNSLLSPAEVELPEGEVWMAAEGEGEGFALRGRFVLRDETAGAGFTRAVKLLLLYLLKKIEVEDLGAKLRIIRVDAEGKQIRVDGLTLSSNEMMSFVRRILSGEMAFLW